MIQASNLIKEEGLDNFGLRKLAREVGVSHSAVYRHFVDKRALLASIALEGHNRLANSFSDINRESLDIPNRLQAIALVYFRWFTKNSAEYEIMFGPRLNQDGLYPDIERAIDNTFSKIDVVFLGLGMDEAVSRQYTVSLTTTLHGYCEMVRLKRIRVSSNKAAESYLLKIIEPFLNGLDYCSQGR